MKKYISIFVVLVVVIVLFGFFGTKSFAPSVSANEGVKNATYTIEGQKVTLKDGVSEIEAAPGSAAKIVTKYFGNEVTADFDGDGRTDTALLLTQTTGGSGTFYYLVAALNTTNGYVGSEAFFLGDRIAPQSTEIKAVDTVVVNYADRKPGDSFAVPPSVGKSISLSIDPLAMEFKVVGAEKPGAKFQTPISFSTRETKTFSDGTLITLREINDSRCKAGTTCIWQGELSPIFVVNGNGFSNEEIRLGTERTKSVSKNGYTFTLQDVIHDSAILMVKKEKISEPKPPVAAGCFIGGCSAQICSDQKDMASTCEYREAYACYKTAKCERQKSGACGWTETSELTACLKGNVTFGSVSGHVTIGPFCPVEKVGTPCPVPPEAYTSREALVYGSDGKIIQKRAHLDTQGNYQIALAPGNYFVQIDPAGIGAGEKKPIMITTSIDTRVDFDIDTGIR